MPDYRDRRTGAPLTFPNLNPSGVNQFSPRPGGLFSVNVDIEALRRMITGIGADVNRAEPAIYQAMRDISSNLMRAQQRVLQERIDQTGRAQRSTRLLVNAIVDDRNRRINVQGFTVGYLDEAWSHVALYYRGLEEGTDVHLSAVSGLLLRGYWITPGGLEGPRGSGKNAIGFSGRYVEQGGFAIKRPIPAYRFLELGARQWLADSNAGIGFLATISKSFDGAGLDWMSRFTRAAGHAPSAGDVSVTVPGIA